MNMEIVDVCGKLIKQILIGNKQQTIDVSNFESGMYIFKLITNKQIYTKTFIKN